MLTFKKAELDDVEALASALDSYRGRICDYSAGNVIFWRDYYGISYHLDSDGLILKYNNMGEHTCYSYPVCTEPIRMIKRLLKDTDGTLCLTCLTEAELETVKTAFEVSEVIYSQDWDDYLYAKDDLVTLSGRRYNGQRNHINKFKKCYGEATFEEINSENAHEAKEFCERYFEIIAKPTDVSDVERVQLVEQFENWERYRQLGGMLKVGETVVGISVGETVGDTLIVHTEKADTSFLGAYPMLTNCFARRFSGECRFINREEDCGEEGLRISKRSYHPIEMIKKYAVIIKELP